MHFWQDTAAAAKSLQSCLTLYDPIEGSPPGSPVPGILQARVLEWVAISFSNAWKWKVKVKLLSRVWLFATAWTAAYQAPLPMGFSGQEYWSGLALPHSHPQNTFISKWEWEWLCQQVCPGIDIKHGPVMSDGGWQRSQHSVSLLPFTGGASGSSEAAPCRGSGDRFRKVRSCWMLYMVRWWLQSRRRRASSHPHIGSNPSPFFIYR